MDETVVRVTTKSWTVQWRDGCDQMAKGFAELSASAEVTAAAFREMQRAIEAAVTDAAVTGRSCVVPSQPRAPRVAELRRRKIRVEAP